MYINLMQYFIVVTIRSLGDSHIWHPIVCKSTDRERTGMGVFSCKVVYLSLFCGFDLKFIA